jgi:predicted nucleic acid-binding Zn ribbon protein
MIASIDKLTDKLDYRDEKQRSFTLRMFTISISISVAGVLGVFLKIFGVF